MRVFLIFWATLLASLSVHCAPDRIRFLEKKQEKRDITDFARLGNIIVEDESPDNIAEVIGDYQHEIGGVERRGIIMDSGFTPSYGYAAPQNQGGYIVDAGAKPENHYLSQSAQYHGDVYNGQHVSAVDSIQTFFPQSVGTPHQIRQQPVYNQVVYMRPVTHYTQIPKYPLRVQHQHHTKPNILLKEASGYEGHNGGYKSISVSGGYTLGGGPNPNYNRKGLVDSVSLHEAKQTFAPVSNNYRTISSNGDYLSSSLKAKRFPVGPPGYSIAYSQLGNLLSGNSGSGSSLYFAHMPTYVNHPMKH